MDRTLITGSSLAEFFVYLKQVHSDGELVAAVTELQQRAALLDHPRLITEAMRILQGQSWNFMLEIGQGWYDSKGQSEFIAASVDRLRKHQDRGDQVVLVSGSWFPSLSPVARALGVGAERVLCSSPEVVDGLLTGVLEHTVFGEGKVRAITEFLTGTDVDLATASAYGDDVADLPMLEMVAHPVAVGSNPALARVAAERGWEQLAVAAVTTI